MIDHVSTYTTHFERSQEFYEAVLPSLGYPRAAELVAHWDTELPGRRMCAWGPNGKPILWLIEVRTPATPRHLALTAKTRALVDQFYAQALAAGGRDNGAPGERPIYHPGYYGAFVFDPDENNLEAVCHHEAP